MLTLFQTRRYDQEQRCKWRGRVILMGPLGVPELIFIFVAALLIFGPKKLPELGRTFGKGMAEFRRASSELKGTFQREMDSIERETRMDEARKAATEANQALQDASYYDDGEDDYYDEYDYDGTAAKKKSESSSAESSDYDSSSSPGGSTDSGEEAVESPSSDSSSNGVQTAKTVDGTPESEANATRETSTA